MGPTLTNLYSCNKGKHQQCNMWEERILVAAND